ncbi:MAG: surface antigen [Candidatus Saccharimonadales bacterium]|jgi:surface antigen
MKRRLFRSKKRLVRNGLVIANIALFIGVAGFILAVRPSSQSEGSPVLSTAIDEDIADPLDALSSNSIALNISLMADLPQSAAVVHNVDAETLKAEIVSSDTKVIAKPQIITTEIKTVRDILDYIVIEGDTVTSIADKYNIQKNSLKWSNDIGGDALSVGDSLVIPPIDGIVYTVEESDTVSSIADDYNATEARIIAFNDIELSGLVAGSKIVVPGGEVAPDPVFSNINYAFAASYGGNGYAPGNCTWHTANRRAAVGRTIPNNLGNAATWAYRARAAGVPTGNIPAQYAAVQTSTGGYGHVGFVEEVFPDGSMRMSEMNYNWRLYALRDRIVPAAEAATYNYIY